MAQFPIRWQRFSGAYLVIWQPFDSKTLLANIGQALRFIPRGAVRKKKCPGVWRKSIITRSAVMEDFSPKPGLSRKAMQAY